MIHPLQGVVEEDISKGIGDTKLEVTDIDI
jgi:hypothetical protein